MGDHNQAGALIPSSTELYSSSFFLMAAAHLFLVSSLTGFYLFPLFITKYGGSKADIGILMGVMALSSVLSRPWVSQMVDRIGRKKTFSIGCLVMTLMPLAYILHPESLNAFYAPLIFIRIIHGLGASLCFTSAFTYMADIIPTSRLNEGMGMFGVTGLTAMALGPALAEIIIKEYGFTTFFLVASGFGFMALLFTLLLKDLYFKSDHESPESFMAVLVKRKILIIFALALLFGAGLAAYGSFAAPFAQERGIRFITGYFIAYSSAAVSARLLGGRIADRVGERKVIPYAMLSTGVGLLIMIFVKDMWWLVISGLVTGGGHGFLFPCLTALAMRNEPMSIRGKISGIFTGGVDAGVFAGSITLGYIGQWAGYEALFLTAGMALILGVGLFKLTLAKPA